jgi:methylated-DNA-[protein]-cysteine S-methyltransferase
MERCSLEAGIRVIETPYGWAALAAAEAGLAACSWLWRSEAEALRGLDRELARLKSTYVTMEPDPRPEITAVLEQAATGLLAFFSGRVKEIEKVPIDVRSATVWQRKVYSVVRDIPHGEVRSYGWVAAACDNPGGARAVGQVMAKNPLPPFIPCHRVVPAGGGLGNYGCSGPAV